MLPANVHAQGDLSKFGYVPPAPPVVFIPEVEPPVLFGQENIPVEEKARVLTDAWMNTVTPSDLAGMKAGEIKKLSEIAGIGSPKRTQQDGNPIILAIVAALGTLGVKAPPQVIEALEAERVDE